MAFQINGSSPPNDCAPGGRSSKLERPEATEADGLGRPCKAVGRPRATVKFQKLSLVGWAWYASFVGTDPYAVISSLQIWDAHKVGGPGYTTFEGGYMYRPKYESFEFGAYTNVEIVFTGLEA